MVGFVLALAGCGGSTAPSDPGGGGPPGIPPTLGWNSIPNTRLGSVCPPDTADYAFSRFCENVIAAWSGAIADKPRNRMIIWGGGHDNYYGNEVYALNLNTLKLERLNSPSPINPDRAQCITTLPDGKPNSRETYNGLTYIAQADRMFAFGGSLACSPGHFGNDTWTLNLQTLEWESEDPHSGGTPNNDPGIVADYDPATSAVYLHDLSNFWKYEYRPLNRYTRLNAADQLIDYRMTPVIDTRRGLFFMMGCKGCADVAGVKVISIAPGSAYVMEDWTSQVAGCDGLITQVYPGLAYDPVQDRIVGWAGDGTVYLFNPDTKSCTTVTYPVDLGAQQPNGTHGRWRYFPGLKLFAIVNDWQQDAHTLRLTP